MARIRVLQLIPSLVGGGAERIAVQLAAELDARRFEVHVASLRPPQLTDLEGVLIGAHIPVRYLHQRRRLDARVFSRLWTLIRHFRPDVMHTHMHAFRHAIPAIVSRIVRQTVHTAHSMAEREQDDVGRLLPRLLFGSRVTVVATAAAVQASIGRVFETSSILIPNGIPVSKFERASKSRDQWRTEEGFAADDLLLTCVGRLDAVKNHALLIDAFAAGPASIAGARLVLVGTGPLGHSLLARAKQAGLGERVKFLGFREDIPDLLHASDVFVSASDSEAGPLSIMESLAAGLPVVGTSTGGVPELVTHGIDGILAPPGDVKSLSKALTRVCCQPEERAAMGRAAANGAARFDIRRMAAAYERLYECLVKDKGYQKHAN